MSAEAWEYAYSPGYQNCEVCGEGLGYAYPELTCPPWSGCGTLSREDKERLVALRKRSVPREEYQYENRIHECDECGCMVISTVVGGSLLLRRYQSGDCEGCSCHAAVDGEAPE